MASPSPAALVCLDLQQGRLLASAQAEQIVVVCRRVLAETRRRGWPILHVHQRHRHAGYGRPIAGLEPLASEPVFVRPGPSAFSHEAFARQAQALGGPLALIGFSLTDTILATAFAAADRNLQTVVLSDGAAPNGPEDGHLRRALTSSLTGLAPICRLIESLELFQEEVAAYAAANAP